MASQCQKHDTPYNNFKWHYGSFSERKVLNLPRRLRDLHKGCPMAPEIMNYNEDMLSEVKK